MFCKEKYKLTLKWESIVYHNDNVVSLIGACFSGPALNDAQQLEAPDSIQLDFTSQLFIEMGTHYIMELKWLSCDYVSGLGIRLGGATLSNKFLKTIYKFDVKDSIDIDTEKHEENVHAFNLVYNSCVVRGSVDG